MTEETLFHEALAKPLAERAAFLDAACKGQPDLRAAIEALLRAHDASRGLLDRPLAMAPDETTPYLDQPVGKQVLTSEHCPAVGAGIVIADRYILQEKIGEGGMGEVWVAKQTQPVKRKVALKLIKAGMDSRAVLQRFDQERQALALMDHPNIARVLDGGMTPTGQPFFVMELVNGLPLLKFCDEMKLTPRERLELFVPICQAVQHAHQKGIVHRDLKPANILVTLIDGKPIPKVIDFGVAKATGGKLTDELLSTQFGAIVGTLEYMAPEQAGISGVDVDTRADIYSLGVVLYEMLTGLRPIDSKRLRKAPFTEMIRIIQEEEPARPSTRLSTEESLPSLAALRQTEPKNLLAMLRGDLDWVVLKCLEKSRERRYETANSLSRDLQRYLADEVVEARPPSSAYRLGKFFKRNKGTVLASGVVVVALLAGMVATTLGLVRATTAEGIANQRYQEAEDARSRAAASAIEEGRQRQKAEQAEAATLADYRASTDDAIEQLIGSKPELGPKEKTYLENTLKRWQAFANRQGQDDRSQAIRAEGHFRVALLWGKLGRREKAQAEFQTARDLWKSLVARFPNVGEYQNYLAASHGNLANQLSDLGNRDQACLEYQESLELQKGLVQKFPDEPAYQEALNQTHKHLGTLFNDLGKREAALAEYQTERDALKKLSERFPTVPKYQMDLAASHQRLGFLLRLLGKAVESRIEYQAASNLWKKRIEAIPYSPETQPEVARGRQRLGNLYRDLGKYEAARAEYQTARDIWKQLVQQFPAMPLYQEELAVSHNNLGSLLYLAEVGKKEDAWAELLAARGIQMKLVEQFPSVSAYQVALAQTRDNLGTLLHVLGKDEDAQGESLAALDLRKELARKYPTMPDFQRDLAENHNNLGNLLGNIGKRDEGREHLQAAVALKKTLVQQFPSIPEYQLSLASTHNNLGSLLLRSKQVGEARQEFELAFDILKKLMKNFPDLPDIPLHLASNHNDYGQQLAQIGKTQEAQDEYRVACSILEKLVEQFPAFHRNQQSLANIHINLGILLTTLKQDEEAKTEFEAALGIQKNLVKQIPDLKEYQIDLGKSYSHLAELKRFKGKFAESLEGYTKAIDTLQAVARDEPPNATFLEVLRTSYLGRARALSSLNHHIEALKDWDQAIERSQPIYRPGHRASRVSSQLQAGRIAEAVAEVAELTKEANWTKNQLYNFACVYAVASAKLTDKNQNYSDRAMELLHKAVREGFKDAAQLAKDTDLDPLRGRQDFKKLLAELEKKP